MNHSIRKELFIIIVSLVAGAVALCWILNYTMLGSVYIRKKETQMEHAYQAIVKAEKSNQLENANFETVLERFCEEHNMQVYVMEPDKTFVLPAIQDFDGSKIIQEYNDIQFGRSLSDKDRPIKDTDDYAIISHYNQRMNSLYMVLYGNIANGDAIYIKTPIQNMRDAASVACQFLLIVGIAVIVIAGILALYLSNLIVRPVTALTEMAEKMVELDFGVRYKKGIWKTPEWKATHAKHTKRKELAVTDSQVYTGNEIDVLGNCINSLSEQLEKTISELKSANASLRKDIKHKTEIDEMRKEFLSNVSHELKTPIALIQGYAEGLADCINDDEASRNFYCEVIMDEAGKMNTMVQKLTKLNQLEFGKEKADMEWLDLHDLITHTVKSMQGLYQPKDITVSVDIPEGLHAWGDAYMTEEVLTNYLSNAINHCEGQKQISVYCKQKDDSLVRFCVYNTGKNIPEDELEKIWIKFYKIDKARTREYGGNGIGLSIVKAIMDAMGQECGVQNVPNGVEFWFELSL